MENLKTKTLILLVIMTIFCVYFTIYTFKTLNPKTEVIVQEEFIPYSNYDFSKLRNKPYYAYDDDNYSSMFGIDVAAHQEKINWQKVKITGVDFAYIRLGYRGATEGKLNTDFEFERNYLGATNNNIKVGVYWYCQAINTKEAIEEAQYVLDVLNDRHLDLPIAFDFEETYLSTSEVSRIHDLTKTERTNIAKAFVEYMNLHNQEVIIYTNLDWVDNYYENDFLSNQKIWFAQYSEQPQLDLPFMIWQYTDRGYVKGVDRNLDLNIMFIQKSDQN